MIRTYSFPCPLPKPEADALNRASGRIYTRALVEHYRIYRQTGHWLSPAGLEKLVDYYDAEDGQERLLHAHSIDAAEQGFPRACKTAKACKQAGWPNAHYPHKRKFWRTTIWKKSGIRAQEAVLLLARARGLEPIRVKLPSQLASLPPRNFTEMRLVWDQASRRYNWHLVVEEAVERQAGTLALGDVRDVADGKQLNAKSQQKVSNWGHGKLRQYITYKAEAAGIAVELVDEHHTSQTCPNCGARHKPRGRLYRCPACGFAAHRDVVGAANILSRRQFGEVGRIVPPPFGETKYRHPFCNRKTGKRSRPDTAEMACGSVALETQEAAPL